MGASMILEYLSWSPDRATFAATMSALTNPVTGEPLASVQPETGILAPSDWVRIDEIGPVVKVDAVYDDEGNEITPAEMVEGHHVNLVAYGALADMLDAGGGWAGIFALLGHMEEVPPVDGVPAAWVGTSGMKIYEAGAVTHRARVWA